MNCNLYKTLLFYLKIQKINLSPFKTTISIVTNIFNFVVDEREGGVLDLNKRPLAIYTRIGEIVDTVVYVIGIHPDLDTT